MRKEGAVRSYGRTRPQLHRLESRSETAIIHGSFPGATETRKFSEKRQSGMKNPQNLFTVPDALCVAVERFPYYTSLSEPIYRYIKNIPFILCILTK